jgi:hypothetical protein
LRVPSHVPRGVHGDKAARARPLAGASHARRETDEHRPKSNDPWRREPASIRGLRKIEQNKILVKSALRRECNLWDRAWRCTGARAAAGITLNFRFPPQETIARSDWAIAREPAGTLCGTIGLTIFSGVAGVDPFAAGGRRLGAFRFAAVRVIRPNCKRRRSARPASRLHLLLRLLRAAGDAAAGGADVLADAGDRVAGRNRAHKEGADQKLRNKALHRSFSLTCCPGTRRGRSHFGEASRAAGGSGNVDGIRPKARGSSITFVSCLYGTKPAFW